MKQMKNQVRALIASMYPVESRVSYPLMGNVGNIV